MTHLSLITLVCWHIVPRMVSLTEWLVWHENSTKGQHQQLFSSPIYQQGQKISSFYDFCSSILYILIIILGIGLFLQYHERIAMLFSHYVQKWIISGKILLIFMGNWLWCIWFHEFFLALDSQNFLAHCALLKTSRQFEEKNCFYCK